jgi:hypothetical protein
MEGATEGTLEAIKGAPEKMKGETLSISVKHIVGSKECLQRQMMEPG